MKSNILRSTILGLLLLSACQPDVKLNNVPEKSQLIVAEKNNLTMVPEIPNKLMPYGNISIKDNKLSFTINYTGLKSEGFTTKAINCDEITPFIRVSITGIGIDTPIYPTGADVNNNIAGSGCTVTASVNNVPYGRARIATIEAYDISNNRIPGTKIMAVFDVLAGTTNADINYRTTPNAQIIQSIIVDNSNPLLATNVNLGDLTTLVDSITGFVPGVTPPSTHTYTTHPYFVNASQIATDLTTNGGDPTLLDANDPAYKVTPRTVTMNFSGLVATDKLATVRVNDPASATKTNIVDGEQVFNVPADTWKTYFALAGTNGTTYTAVASSPVSSDTTIDNVNIGTIVLTPAKPVITSLSASQGAVGTTIIITGTNFHAVTDANIIKFGTTVVTPTFIDATHLSVVVPNITVGSQPVTVAVGTQTSDPSPFNISQAPTITSFVATTGPSLTEVTITGTDFIGTTSVKFGTVEAFSFIVDNNTTIRARVPGGSGTGAVKISVTANAFPAAVSTGDFTISNPVFKIYFVKAGATGTGAGTNWTNAIPDIQTALTTAAATDQIWVAQGTFKPSLPAGRGATFNLNGRDIYGGFIGDTTQTTLASRNLTANVTILSGDIDNNNILDAGNSYHVVTTAAAGSRLDGVTVTAGNANGTVNDSQGGGFRNSVVGSTTIENVIFSGNNATNGGGFYNINNGNSSTLTNVTFNNNTASLGGAVYNSITGTLTMTNPVFNGNSAGDGGALYNTANGTKAILSNATFTNNYATTGNGGAIHNSVLAKLTLGTSSIFSGNYSTAGKGGAIYNNGNGSDITLTSPVFTSNTAALNGGAIYNLGQGSLSILTSARFTSNSTSGLTSGGGALYNDGNGTKADLTGAIFVTNSSVVAGGAVFNTSQGTLTLSKAVFSGNTLSDAASTGGGLYNNGNGTVANLSNVIFAGNTAFNGGGLYNLSQAVANIVNATFSGNNATNVGGAVHNSGTATVNLKNSIIWGNTATLSNPNIFNSATVKLGFSDFEGGATAISGTFQNLGGSITLTSGNYNTPYGNINASPLFANALNPAGTGTFLGTDAGLLLGSGSPALNGGTDTLLTIATPTVDLRGDVRPQNGGYDMGAYEQ